MLTARTQKTQYLKSVLRDLPRNSKKEVESAFKETILKFFDNPSSARNYPTPYFNYTYNSHNSLTAVREFRNWTLFNTQTNLYYLQTRYYDPAIRRFINADNYKLVPALAGQRGGLNMYAYALNNPVSYVDPSGQFAKLTPVFMAIKLMLFTPVGGVVTQAAVSAGCYIGMTVWAFGDLAFNNGQGAWADMNRIRWNPFNRDEHLVLASRNISFYRGMPVFRYGDRNRTDGFSYGVIGLGRGLTGTHIDHINVVRHEWGHNRQMMRLGLGGYTLAVAIPSVISARTDPGNHRNQWFERWADELGGAVWGARLS